MEKSRSSPGLGTLGVLGSRVLTFSGILAAGTGMSMALAMVRIAVLTRLLDISVYGELTLLVITAGLVTVVCRMSIVTGTLLSAFRGGDEVEDEDDPERETGDTDDPGRVIGSGLAAVLALTIALTALAAVFYEPLDKLLIDNGARLPIAAAFLLGGLEGTFHLVSTIARYERRPAAFVLLQLFNGIIGLVLAAVLIQAGHGLSGAIGGLALGTGLALVPAFVVNRHRFSLSLSRSHLVALTQKGAPFILITAGLWSFRHVDIFMVSRYLPDADVALYRAAARIGAVASGIVGAILLARGPLMRGPIRGALHRENLLISADSRVLTYVLLLGVWLMVIFVLTRNVLIKIVPEGYSGAATLIPLLGLAAVAGSVLLVIFRTSRLSWKRRFFTVTLVLMSLATIGLSMLLIPSFGLEGAAAAAIAPPLVSAACFIAISQRYGGQTLEVAWDRIAIGFGAGGLYVAVFFAASYYIHNESMEMAAGAVAALLFPVVMILSGALPRSEARKLREMLPSVRRSPSIRRESFSLLSSSELELLNRLVRRRDPPDEVARSRGQAEEEILTELVRVLRVVRGTEAPQQGDVEIGRLLTSSKNVGQRDREGHLLAMRSDIDSVEVDELLSFVEEVQSMSDLEWQQLSRGAEAVAQ